MHLNICTPYYQRKHGTVIFLNITSIDTIQPRICIISTTGHYLPVYILYSATRYIYSMLTYQYIMLYGYRFNSSHTSSIPSYRCCFCCCLFFFRCCCCCWCGCVCCWCCCYCSCLCCCCCCWCCCCCHGHCDCLCH